MVDAYRPGLCVEADVCHLKGSFNLGRHGAKVQQALQGRDW